jgi:hypothetical protein
VLLMTDIFGYKTDGIRRWADKLANAVSWGETLEHFLGSPAHYWLAVLCMFDLHDIDADWGQKNRTAVCPSSYANSKHAWTVQPETVGSSTPRTYMHMSHES